METHPLPTTASGALTLLVSSAAESLSRAQRLKIAAEQNRVAAAAILADLEDTVRDVERANAALRENLSGLRGLARLRE